MVIELDSMETVKQIAPLWNNHSNQLRRIVGRGYSVVYCGGVTGGTVRDEAGKCWDWWPTDEVLPGGFTKIRVVEAR